MRPLGAHFLPRRFPPPVPVFAEARMFRPQPSSCPQSVPVSASCLMGTVAGRRAVSSCQSQALFQCYQGAVGATPASACEAPILQPGLEQQSSLHLRLIPVIVTQHVIHANVGKRLHACGNEPACHPLEDQRTAESATDTSARACAALPTVAGSARQGDRQRQEGEKVEDGVMHLFYTIRPQPIASVRLWTLDKRPVSSCPFPPLLMSKPTAPYPSHPHFVDFTKTN